MYESRITRVHRFSLIYVLIYVDYVYQDYDIRNQDVVATVSAQFLMYENKSPLTENEMYEATEVPTKYSPS